jgi:hypothetical protein
MVIVTRSALALLPVLLFLSGLILMDAYRLVRPWSVARALGWGAAAAAAGYAANGAILSLSGLAPLSYAVTIGPVVEEALKNPRTDLGGICAGSPHHSNDHVRHH